MDRTESNMTTETTSGPGGSPVREESREVADTAKERAGGVAQTAREQAGDVVAHTQAEARDLLQELRTSLRQQTQAQRDRMAEVLGGFEQELQHMVDQGGGSGPATEVIRQAAQRCRTWRQYLEDDSDVVGDLRSFARRRPGTFLLAAATAGVVAGRITRGARDAKAVAQDDESSGVQGAADDSPTGAVYPPPVAPGSAIAPSIDPGEAPYGTGGTGRGGVE